MKKLTCIFLIFAMAFTAAACAYQQPATAPEESAAVTTEGTPCGSCPEAGDHRVLRAHYRPPAVQRGSLLCCNEGHRRGPRPHQAQRHQPRSCGELGDSGRQH